MGHIVVGTPGIDRFHLHERLIRTLRQRGHRVSLLCTSPAAQTFWRHQDEGLAKVGTALQSWFATEAPDLLLLHQDRTADAVLLQFCARAVGCRVLWTGDGLLPHTLQVDERGIDGDASCSRRGAGEFRVVTGEPDLLRACLASALAQTLPFGLPRVGVQVPPLLERLRDVLPMLGDNGVAGAWQALTSWCLALEPQPAASRPWVLPPAPFVTVLLQRPDDARVLLDGGNAPSSTELVRQTANAVQALNDDVRLVIVAAGSTRLPRFGAHTVVPAAAAAVAAATALATVTINHPLASIALLAGTPVLHTGHALYGVRGVATRVTAEQLTPALPTAIAHDHPTLRQRFLSWTFGYGHLWCSSTHPDHNGVLGLAQAIEARLAEPAHPMPPLRYRRGPAWPLAAEGRRS